MSYDIIELLNNQIEEWKLLSDNYNTYDNAPCEKILFGKEFWTGHKILLNYRKASLSADLKAIAAGERPCFLCPNARPALQRAIIWDDYEILCNPYPASEVHYTIVNRNHIPQRLGERIIDMARLTRVMPECCIFYNGPQCGASAPDHMHFQAVDKQETVNFMYLPDYLIDSVKVGKSRLYVPRANLTAFGHFILDIKKDSDIMPLFDIVLASFPEYDGDEPMMNVLAFKLGGTTRIIIIPRKRHRPQCYGTDAGQMLISPASLEMMGKFITSRQEDYDRLDEPTMQRIYDDVGYSSLEFLEFVKRLPK